MTKSTDREIRLLRIVSTILDPPESVDADQLSQLEDEFSELIDHPGGAALIHYPEQWGLGDSPNPKQIVDEALGWTPVIVKMTVSKVRPHYKLKGEFVYELTDGRIQTQVVSKVQLSLGQSCEVALSGAKLPDGTFSRHGFIGNTFTAGVILPPEK